MKTNYFKKPFYCLFSFILYLSIINKGKTEKINNKNFIIIPFKSYFPKFDYSSNVNKALINSWIRRKLYLDVENKSGQKLQIILNREQPQMHTRDIVALLRTDENYIDCYNHKDLDICTFNFNNSKSYELTSEFNQTFYSISKVCNAKETIALYNDFNLKQKKLYNIEFIHSSNETNICFFASVQKTESPAYEKINLLNQLKNLINSNSFSWTLKFTSPDEGFFIFGDIINNNKINFYNDNIEENYMTLEFPSSSIYWKLYFDKVILGDYVIQSQYQIYFFFNLQRRYITVPKEYYYDIRSKYLLINDYDEKGEMKFICHDEETEFFFNSVYCNKKDYLKLTDNYKKLPTLNLYGYHLGVNITFTPKELFLEKGDYVYFYIGYDSHNEEDWYMGSIFVEKYITVFDNNDNKMMLKILKKSDKIVNENKQNNALKIFLIILLVFFITALIFVFIGIFFGKNYFQKRRKMANELDDEYDYQQKKDDKNLLIN